MSDKMATTTRRSVLASLSAVALLPGCAGSDPVAAPPPAREVVSEWRPPRRFVRALILGVNDYLHAEKLEGAVRDADLWAAVAYAGGIEQQAVVRAPEDVSAARFEELFRAFVDDVRRERSADPLACGLFVFAGHGAVLGSDRSGICMRDFDPRTGTGAVPLDCLSEALGHDQDEILAVVDACTQGNAPPREAATGTPVRWRCATPTADIRGKAPRLEGGRGSPCTSAGPRFGQAARLLATRPEFLTGESQDPDTGLWSGEITRHALQVRGWRALDLPIFGQEIGPGTNNFVDYTIRDATGGLVGRLRCTATGIPLALHNAGFEAQRAYWWWDQSPPFRDRFYLHPQQLVSPDPTKAILKAMDLPFPTNPTQNWSPPTGSWKVWRIGLNDWNGTVMGYLFHDEPLGQQHWLSPPGAVDNHGFLAVGGTDDLYFELLPTAPTVPSTWRHVQTYPLAP